ncbi:hypothetical protein [Arthrobacter sp. HY1533]|uniref:hypothetical protein n=1 Tax=Arthrobacter sp. HY1533 TaxID=2970919 RepID=UPI0022BA03F7|nr:hypothetical protein [Arthrobacter sp. HY1533]
MSYDLSVYATAPLGLDGLLALVRSTAGLDGDPSGGADSLMVVRGARRKVRPEASQSHRRRHAG